MGHCLPNRLTEAWLRGFGKRCQQSVRNTAPRGGGQTKDLLGGRRQDLDPQHQGIPEVGRESVEAVNLGYLDPTEVDLAAYQADPDTFVEPHAGEVLYRLRNGAR